MRKFISLLNSQSFYYLWQNEKGRKYLSDVINRVLSLEDEYDLLPTNNIDNTFLRSYVFLENEKNLILVDFNYKTTSHNKIKMNLELLNFLKITNSKKIIMIVFNNYRGNNTFEDDMYYIYRNTSNPNLIRSFLCNNRLEQKLCDSRKVTNYLYSLGKDFYKIYLKELEKEQMIYNMW